MGQSNPFGFLELLWEIWLIGWTFEYWWASVWTIATTVTVPMVALIKYLNWKEYHDIMRRVKGE